MFYAIEYAHGKTMVNGHYTIYGFNTKSARDEFVRNGSDFVDGSGYRETIGQSHRKAQKAIKADTVRHVTKTTYDAEGYYTEEIL